MLPCPGVAAPAPRAIVGGVALESPHFHLGKAHHYQKLAEAGAHFVGLTILEPSQVEAFNMLSVVGQRSYSNAQEHAQVYKDGAGRPCCSDRSVRFLVDFPAAYVRRATLTPATIRPTSRIACCWCILAAVTTACGKKTQEVPDAAPPRAEHVAGSERFGWTQSASDRLELSTFHYAVYLDGARVELTDVSCEPSSSTVSTQFECSAPLPPMSAGTHALELAMFIVKDGGLRESPRSAPLMITKAGAETAGGGR